MNYGTKKEVDRLLEAANKIMMEVSHIDVTTEEKKEAKSKCKALYNQIKLLDAFTYKLISKSSKDGVL